MINDTTNQATINESVSNYNHLLLESNTHEDRTEKYTKTTVYRKQQADQGLE